jgi:hypothetical protein
MLPCSALGTLPVAYTTSHLRIVLLPVSIGADAVSCTFANEPIKPRSGSRVNPRLYVLHPGYEL